MTTEYTRSLLRVALAQICQNLGWNSMHSTPMEILTDVLERYITRLGTYSHRYSEQFGRVEPNLADLGLAFQELGVNLTELGDFVKHVDPIPFALDVPKFPIRRPNQLHCPKPNSRELYEREEHVHDHMPTMHPGWDEEIVVTDASGSDVAGAADKRSATTPGEDEPSAKRLRSRVYPEEAAASTYTLKSVRITDTGDICGHGKLPEANAPPPPTPTTPMPRPPLFKTPSLPTIHSDPPSPGADAEDIVSMEEVKAEIKLEAPQVVVKAPRGRPPKSPKVGFGSPSSTPKSVPGFPLEKKKRGRPFKTYPSPGRPAKAPVGKVGRPPGRPAKSPGRPPKSPGRPPKSPGRPPKSPGRPPKSPGRPPKSPGRPPKSPFQSPTRSPGRPPKSPSAKSPIRSPLTSPLSPRSPAVIGRGRSPGRPPKSPGRVGRPPKSPGRVGRPPKSPGRPPGSKKDPSARLPQSPVSQYLLTGEMPIGERGVPTKAQLKQQPIHSPPPRVRKPSGPVQKYDFTESPIDTENDMPVGVSVDTDIISTTQLSSHAPKSERLKKPTGSIDDAIAAVIKQGEAEDANERRESVGEMSESTGARESFSDEQIEREDMLRQVLNQEEIEPEHIDIKQETPPDPTGRVTPDWIRQQAAEMDKLRAENQIKSKTVSDTAHLSPYHDFKRVDSPKEKSISKKSKKKDKEKRRRDGESDKERQIRKDKRLEEKLREKLRETSQSSSSPERTVPSSEKTETIPALRIGIGAKFTIKPVTEESDKEVKKVKKKKKKKEKDRDLDEREKSKKKREKIKKDDEESVPKLKFKLLGQGKAYITPTDSPRTSPKRDIPKLVIKQREESSEKRVFTKRPKKARSPSPLRNLTPPPMLRSPLRVSPMRFTPSPESNPNTPSMGSPFHLPSPMRSLSPSKAMSSHRSLSPAKTSSLAPLSPSSSYSPPPYKVPLEGDVMPPPPPSSKGGNKRAVFAETQGTIIGENGEIIWICPACTRADDGSPMIGCDVCDDWYHWTCMGITQEPPEDESWYCPKHRSSEPPRKTPTRGRGRGRGKKKKI